MNTFLQLICCASLTKRANKSNVYISTGSMKLSGKNDRTNRIKTQGHGFLPNGMKPIRCCKHRGLQMEYFVLQELFLSLKRNSLSVL